MERLHLRQMSCTTMFVYLFPPPELLQCFYTSNYNHDSAWSKWGSTILVESIISGCITYYYNLSSFKQQAYTYVQSLICVWLFATLWSVAHQAPLSMGVFVGRNTEVGCHFFLHDIFLTGDQTQISCISCTAGRFITAEPLGKPSVCQSSHSLAVSSSLFLTWLLSK